MKESVERRDAPIQADQITEGGLDPLFRWTGGKRWLVDSLRELLPSPTGRYFEPFLGGGALFFSLLPKNACLSDTNEDLIGCYRQIRDDPQGLSELLINMPRDRDFYYEVRGSRPTTVQGRAARVIYLSTLAFNGIYRVNKAGHFNVPYGNREYSADLWSADRLTSYSKALRKAVILGRDFAFVLDTASAGDFLYFDPPYTVTHSNNGFVKYNGTIFSWQDQQRLANVVAELDRRGCRVVVSNAFHPSVRALYPNLEASVVTRSSTMAADITKRRPVQEYLFSNVR